MLILYEIIRFLFKTASGVFYASFDIRGVSNVPPSNSPTLLVFNHGNSLGDAVAIIATCPRTVHFCAKNTLWDIPFFSTFIKMSGAIPVYRRKEHGDKAKDFNVETFRAVYKALDAGNCVAFAPEGISSFTSYATKFKNGVAYIAIEAVLRQKSRGNETFCVQISPAIMAWTHREKFRSDVLVRFTKPLKIDYTYVSRFLKEKKGNVVDNKAMLNGNVDKNLEILKGEIDIKKAADFIIKEVEDEFHENIINAPNWKIIKLAIAATRIHRPLGTYLSLSSYMYLLKGWIDILKTAESESSSKLLSELENYQNLIDKFKVKDVRFRRIEIMGNRDTTFKSIRIILYRATVSSILFVICIPGLLIWSPVWFFIKRKEKLLLQQGAGWVDSIAEHKMLYSWIFVVALILIFNVFSPILLLYLWLTMRLYEEAVASSRSVFGITRLLFMSDSEVQSVLLQRKKAKDQVWQGVQRFPKETAERIKTECGDNVFVLKNEYKMENETLVNEWWWNFNLMRRRKKDWNEILRFSDYCTMDYVE